MLLSRDDGGVWPGSEETSETPPSLVVEKADPGTMNLSNLPQLKLQLVSMLHCIPMVKVFKDMLKKRARSARFWICTAVHGYSQLRSQYKGKQ